jgi:hypothetical protein
VDDGQGIAQLVGHDGAAETGTEHNDVGHWGFLLA